MRQVARDSLVSFYVTPSIMPAKIETVLLCLSAAELERKPAYVFAKRALITKMITFSILRTILVLI